MDCAASAMSASGDPIMAASVAWRSRSAKRRFCSTTFSSCRRRHSECSDRRNPAASRQNAQAPTNPSLATSHRLASATHTLIASCEKYVNKCAARSRPTRALTRAGTDQGRVALCRLQDRFSPTVARALHERVTFLATELAADAAPGDGMFPRRRDLHLGDRAFTVRVHHRAVLPSKARSRRSRSYEGRAKEMQFVST